MVDIKKVAVGILFLIIFIILVFTLVGNTASDLRDAADSITDANNCSDGSDLGGSYVYNFTSKGCENSSGQHQYTAGQIDLPLNTLFGRSSILILIFMVVILIISIITVFKGMKNKV